MHIATVKMSARDKCIFSGRPNSREDSGSFLWSVANRD